MEQPKDTQKEIEHQLSELEERVDRLRALYEQYFMGYEKLEPSVPRKDVDRRFVLLRKMQLRNTAVRFRFNVITQKFNTYAMYWVRVCRQIEEGTYKRHIVKAQRRFGDGAGVTRRGAVREEEGSSIDVDLGDFEDAELDMDAVLREADAAAEAYGNSASDTLPPAAGPISEPPLAIERPMTQPLAFRPAGPALRPRASTEPLQPVLVPSAPELAAAAPSSTSFALRGGRESLGMPESRPMRAAALPAGAKAKVLVRRGEGPESTSSVARPPLASPPESERAPALSLGLAPTPGLAPTVRPRMPSMPDSERTPVSVAARAPAPPPSTSSIRPSPGTSPDVPTQTSQPYRPAARPANLESTGRIVVARPPAAVGKMPAAAVSAGPAGRDAAPSAPGGAPSSSRMPTAPMRVATVGSSGPSSSRPTTGIMERQPISERAPSTNRIPADARAGGPNRRPPPPLPSASGKTAKKP